ncbi:MAG TPA: pseudouridine synthase [Candidatus Babeliales bacterium]|nr:pseudouridine synthase [Candidatus Babeliales bacterium]
MMNEIQKKVDRVIESAVERIVLNKYIAHAGVCSRREAVELIKQGSVKVNGVIITEPSYIVQPKDFVKVGSKGVRPEQKVYVLLNKPTGYVTTVEDEQGRRTVADLVRDVGRKLRLYPVGRLDRDTTGLLIMTNDGALTQKLSHPKNHVQKKYSVVLDKPFPVEDLKKLKEGVTLIDGRAYVDAISYGESKRNNVVKIVLHSGKNRIVRRMFEHLGYRVMQLDRINYAGVTKQGLMQGRWRFLEPEELASLLAL